MTSFYDFEALDIQGNRFSLSNLKGKKVLVVNVASECGLTPQYAQLQELYEAYKDKNFMVIAFPANNFGSQEPGSNEEIAQFCETKFGVRFLMMEKVSVKGDDCHPVYAWLTNYELNGVESTEVSWNFQKYMIDEEGNYVGMVHPQESPMCDTILDWLNK
jgi:glutathione peroxidase